MIVTYIIGVIFSIITLFCFKGSTVRWLNEIKPFLNYGIAIFLILCSFIPVLNFGVGIILWTLYAFDSDIKLKHKFNFIKKPW